MSDTLNAAFDVTGYPADKRGVLTEQLMNALLSHDMTLQTDTSISAEAKKPDLRATLPKEPPATWKYDKQPGDTPPDFIRRHYGQWLHEDTTGITRQDIRNLDSTLYMALANWLRKNALPADCPLPKQSEIIDQELGRSPPPSASDAAIAREVSRWRSRTWRRQQSDGPVRE